MCPLDQDRLSKFSHGNLRCAARRLELLRAFWPMVARKNDKACCKAAQSGKLSPCAPLWEFHVTRARSST